MYFVVGRRETLDALSNVCIVVLRLKKLEAERMKEAAGENLDKEEKKKKKK